MEQMTGSKLGKEYVKVVYCHAAYLTYMQGSVQFSCSVVFEECIIIQVKQSKGNSVEIYHRK